METPEHLSDIAVGCTPTLVPFGQDSLFAAFTSTSGSLRCVRGTTNLGSQSGATKWDAFGTIAEKGDTPFSVALTLHGNTLFSFFDPGDHAMHMACCDVFGDAKWEQMPNITPPGTLIHHTSVSTIKYHDSDYVFFQTVSGAMGVCRGSLCDSGKWVSLDSSEFPFKLEGHWTVLTDTEHIIVLTTAGFAQTSVPDSDGVFHWTSKPHMRTCQGYRSVAAANNGVTFNGSQWMTSLGDNTPFTGLSIPGTHDSCTYKFRKDGQGLAFIGQVVQSLQAVFVKDPEYNKRSAYLYHLIDIATTQDRSLDEQLNDGIRFFDVRLGLFEDDGVGILKWVSDYLEEVKMMNFATKSLLQMCESAACLAAHAAVAGHVNHLCTYHNFVPLGVSFDDVLTSFKNFLAAHPKESVVMLVRREHDPWASIGQTNQSALATMFQDVFTKTINDFTHQGLQFINETQLPATLAEARGKVVIVQDGAPIPGAGMSFAAVPSPVDGKDTWTSHPGYKQDAWGVESGEDKWKVLEENMSVVQAHDSDTAENRRFVISFASATNGDPTKGLFPKVVAECVQPHLREFLQTEAKREHPRSVGVVALDYYDMDIPGLIAACSNNVQ